MTVAIRMSKLLTWVCPAELGYAQQELCKLLSSKQGPNPKMEEDSDAAVYYWVRPIITGPNTVLFESFLGPN